MTSSGAPISVGKIEVQLLDPSSGRPVKIWNFVEQPQISIGRLPELDIEISDPYVSRNHATLMYQDGKWFIVSQGRHGVLIDHRHITEQVIENDTVFRLGAEGPTFRFRLASENAMNSNTITFDALPTISFSLDQDKIENEVRDIVEADYFQTLQQRAKALRARQHN
jgi:pSer/pThr/pTyr-binding forkhead associated (FHA) protein